MSKKYWLIILIFIVLTVAILHRYFNYQFSKFPIPPGRGMGNEKETTEIKEIKRESEKSIPLEKPPFLK
jgi:hypothetical protein